MTADRDRLQTLTTLEIGLVLRQVNSNDISNGFPE